MFHRKTISVNIAIQEELEEIQKKCKKVKDYSFSSRLKTCLDKNDVKLHTLVKMVTGNIACKQNNIKVSQNEGEIAELLGKIWALECQMRQNR